MLKLNSQNNTHQLQLQKLEHYYTEKTSKILSKKEILSNNSLIKYKITTNSSYFLFF